MLYFEGRCVNPALQLCWTHLKGLYGLEEINQRRLHTREVVYWTWDLYKHLDVTYYVLVHKPCLTNTWKKDDQCTSILLQADRPELPLEVDLRRKSLSPQDIFWNVGDLGSCLLASPKRVWWVCKHFVLEPWWKMMRRGQLSFWLKQINLYQR